MFTRSNNKLVYTMPVLKGSVFPVASDQKQIQVQIQTYLHIYIFIYFYLYLYIHILRLFTYSFRFAHKYINEYILYRYKYRNIIRNALKPLSQSLCRKAFVAKPCVVKPASQVMRHAAAARHGTLLCERLCESSFEKAL